MHTTSLSLLERLRWPEEQEANWRRFVQLYTPLLFHWARRLGLSAEDASELNHYLEMEHLMRLAKARARQYLADQ